MKPFILLFILSLGLMACSTEPPQLNDTETTIEVSDFNGTELISIDALPVEANLLYASLSAAPQEELDPTPAIAEGQTTLDYILRNWQWLLAALIPLLEIIVRLTPTEKDNTILSRALGLLGKFFPNIKKGGGTHTTPG